METLASIKGKIIIITGGCGHIGKKTCSEIKKYGGHVIILDRKEAIEKSNIQDYDIMECNLEREEEIESSFKKITSKYNAIDGIVNNAAFVGTDSLKGWNTKFGEQSLETWDRCLNVNLRAIFKIAQCSENALKASTRVGSIVNIGSIYGIVGPQWEMYQGTQMGNPAAYAASKGGLIQLTRWLATTLAPQIRTNTISAGGIYRNHSKEFLEEYSKRTPMGRMGTEDDVVASILFLLSDMSTYINGHNLVVDGGWSTW